MDRMSKRNTKRLESPLPTENRFREVFNNGQYLVGKKEKNVLKTLGNGRLRS